jgi:hypothetical protein
MKIYILILTTVLLTLKAQAQVKKTISKVNTTKQKTTNSLKTDTSQPKIMATPRAEPVKPKNVVASINLDKYITTNDATAFQEIDSTYKNSQIINIENVEKLMTNRKFDLIRYIVEKYEATPDINYLYYLNTYNFVCGVGLKRTKTVSPACAEAKNYETNKESEAKVKLAEAILKKGVKADFLAVERCIGKNELELFKLLYTNLNLNNNDFINGERLLVEACDYGMFDIVKYLIDNKVSANAYDHSVEIVNNKFYAIYRSVKYLEIFNLLIENGADYNKKGYNGTTPIIHAAREGCTEVIQYLLDKGIDPYEKQGNLSAYEMAKKYNEKNKKEVIELLKKYKKETVNKIV